MATDPMLDPDYKYSINKFTGNGSKTSWDLNFAGGYIRREHIKAYTQAENGQRSDVSFTWAGPNTIVIAPPVANNVTLVVYRDTPKSSPIVDFTDGAVLSETSLDTCAKQSVFIAAEMVDQFSDVVESVDDLGLLVGAAEEYAENAAYSLSQTIAEAEAVREDIANAPNLVMNRATRTGDNLLTPATWRQSLGLKSASMAALGLASGQVPLAENVVRVNGGIINQPVDELQVVEPGEDGLTPVGIYLSPNLNLSFKTDVSTPGHTEYDGDDQRTMFMLVGETRDDGNSEEQLMMLQFRCNTGYSRPYLNNTLYKVGENVTMDSRNTVYRCVQEGITSATGTGPTGRGDAIPDGTAVWKYINDAAINAKLPLYIEATYGPNAGSAWGQVINTELEPGHKAPFFCSQEIDLTNKSGTDSEIGGLNRYGRWVALQGPNRSTSADVISSANTETFAAFWGTQYIGAKLARRAVIGMDGGGGDFGIDIAGLVNVNYLRSAYRDQSVAPTAIALRGQNSSETLAISADSPAAIVVSGPKSLTSYLDLSTSPFGAHYSGTYSSSAIQVSGRAPVAYVSTGIKDIAAFYDSSQAPFGFYATGAYSSAAFASHKFSVISGVVSAAGLALLDNARIRIEGIEQPRVFVQSAQPVTSSLKVGDLWVW